MTDSPLLKRLLDAGAQFGEMSQKNAEKLVNDFVKAGQLRRKDAEKTVQHLVERGRSSTERWVSVIQAEVSKQLGRFAERLDEVESRVEDVAGNLGLASKTAAKKAATTTKAAGPSGVAKVVARKAPAKKAAAKKAPAKKAATKKAPAKKAAAKKAPAKS
jgi:polyhydroxyalkanoate synthesis regulator phasin